MDEETFLKEARDHTLNVIPNPFLMQTGIVETQNYQDRSSYPYDQQYHEGVMYETINGQRYAGNQNEGVGACNDRSGIDYYRKMQLMEQQQEHQKKILQESFITYQKSWAEECKKQTIHEIHSIQQSHQSRDQLLSNGDYLVPGYLDEKLLLKEQQEVDNENTNQQMIDESGLQTKEDKATLNSPAANNQINELSFEEFAFTEQLFTASKKNSKDSGGQLIEKYILHQNIKPVEVFLINGEIILSFEIFDRRPDKEHDKVSLWNLFRPISQITVKKKIIEVSMHKSQGVINDFQPLIQRLMSMPDQQAHKSGQMLQQHYMSLQEEHMIKQQVFEVYKSRISHLQWQFEENFHRSKEMAYNLMEQLPEDAFFLYSIRRTDPISLDSIFCALGYSKALIRLVAGNESNYQQFCLRSGLVEIFNGSSRLQILLMNLLFSNKVEISITTLDDYTIPIEMRVHYQKLIPTEILPGVFKEDYMKIYQILIDTKYIDELKRIRGTDNNTVGAGKIGNIESSIVQPDQKYQDSATKFVEKFYSESLKDKRTGNDKKNVADPKDPNNFSAVFQRIFGNQNEGQNFLTSVFNTKVTTPGTQNISRSSNTVLLERNYQNGEDLSGSQHSSHSQPSSASQSYSFLPKVSEQQSYDQQNGKIPYKKQ